MKHGLHVLEWFDIQTTPWCILLNEWKWKHWPQMGGIVVQYQHCTGWNIRVLMWQHCHAKPHPTVSMTVLYCTACPACSHAESHACGKRKAESVPRHTRLQTFSRGSKRNPPTLPSSAISCFAGNTHSPPYPRGSTNQGQEQHGADRSPCLFLTPSDDM